MSITDSNSALILGAGTSEPFSMPLGGQLVSGIARQIRKELSQTRVEHKFGGKVLAVDRIADWGRLAASWHANPIHGSVVAARVDAEGRISEDGIVDACIELENLLTLLTNQTAETIDAFIAENPKLAPVTKIAVAAMMIRAMYSVKADDKGSLALKSFDARDLDVTHRGEGSPRRERNWIHLLINIVRHAVDEGHIDKGNKVKIVTFNYDTILEHVLEKQFSNRESSPGHYSEFIEIHHVHGKFGDILESTHTPWHLARDWGQQICVVKEGKPSEAVSAARARAAQIIRDATDVYAAGFSFAGPNCRLIKLTDAHPTKGRSLTFCNYIGNRGIAESAKRYVPTIAAHQEVFGDYSRPMSISDFILGGYLGEPPG